eukprot:2392706-Pleurochrysis_carterae.AAC.2
MYAARLSGPAPAAPIRAGVGGGHRRDLSRVSRAAEKGGASWPVFQPTSLPRARLPPTRSVRPKSAQVHSSILELFEFIRLDNIKSLVAHVAETYKEQLSAMNHVDIFQARSPHACAHTHAHRAVRA